MSISKLFLAGLGCVTCFMWGMAVGTNDQRQLASYDVRMAALEMQARAECGFGHYLAVTAEGLACVDRGGNVTRLAGVER